MTTAAPRNEIPATLEELDERTQDAWAVYSESLRDLTGRDYDEAETDAWDHLQRQLRELEEFRAELLSTHA
jgi:rubrerythrin